jgi:hypothetical protein
MLGRNYKGEAKARTPLSVGRRLRPYLAGAVVLFLAGCGLERPQSPQWTVSLELPVADRRIDGEYLAANAGIESLDWRPDSGLVWHIGADLDTVYLNEHLTLASQRGTFIAAFRQLHLGDGAVTQTTLALADLHPQPAGFIAAFSGSTQRQLPAVAAIDSAQVVAGLLRIDIHNQLGIALDSVEVLLTNAGAPVPFATIAVPGPIYSGDSAVGSAPLDGQTITGQWQFRLKFHTPGGTILSADDKYVTVSAHLPDGVRASYARGAIDSAGGRRTDSIRISAEHRLTAAVFHAGTLRINWNNRTPLPVTIRWTSPDLTRNGAPLAQTTLLAAYEDASEQIDLASCHFSSPAASLARFDVSVESGGSAGQVISLSAEDGVGCDLTLAGLRMESATGVLAPTTQSVGPLSTQISWKDGLAQTGLDRWELGIVVASSLPLPVVVNGRLTTDTGLDLPFTGTVNAATDGHPAPTRLTIPHPSAPLQPLPCRVTLAGQLTYGDGATIVSLGESDFAFARIEASAPSHLYVDGVSLKGNPTAVALTSDNFGDRHGRLLQGEVTITTSNRFPLGGALTFSLAADSSTLAGAPALVFGPSELAAAATDDDGYATAPTISTMTFRVGASDITLFERDTIWFNEAITLHGPGGNQPARISATDVLQLTAMARLDVKVGN